MTDTSTRPEAAETLMLHPRRLGASYSTHRRVGSFLSTDGSEENGSTVFPLSSRESGRNGAAGPPTPSGYIFYGRLVQLEPATGGEPSSLSMVIHEIENLIRVLHNPSVGRPAGRLAQLGFLLRCSVGRLLMGPRSRQFGILLSDDPNHQEVSEKLIELTMERLRNPYIRRKKRGKATNKRFVGDPGERAPASRAGKLLLLPKPPIYLRREQITRHLQDVIGLCKCYGDFQKFLSENKRLLSELYLLDMTLGKVIRTHDLKGTAYRTTAAWRGPRPSKRIRGDSSASGAFIIACFFCCSAMKQSYATSPPRCGSVAALFLHCNVVAEPSPPFFLVGPGGSPVSAINSLVRRPPHYSPLGINSILSGCILSLHLSSPMHDGTFMLEQRPAFELIYYDQRSRLFVFHFLIPIPFNENETGGSTHQATYGSTHTVEKGQNPSEQVEAKPWGIRGSAVSSGAERSTRPGRGAIGGAIKIISGISPSIKVLSSEIGEPDS
eukprot:Gb_29045 [translate_table: standard]